ncbi:cytochrome c biogenesis protein DipZ [Azospirillum canadense]|uniref:cytochrome c biogenesis protein DipZ n=1 Tax=Azospirillum canadense TaxID=403962 RepID=UPI0022266CD6|nr:cytochrome c biogenesis protein DipZ [Azospirillum canadense]MCW2242441.1 cytochrome c biogenesis protein CcdA/thiol-disulfide isomerase/thioredoxin [Azospirillum canadense]
MAFILIAYAGGMLTVFSPCILPILPIVFARANRPFLTSTLPMLLAMGCMFAGIAALAAVGGSWAVYANAYGRFAAIALIAVFGVTLISPAVAGVLTRRVVALGNRLSQTPAGQDAIATTGGSLMLGVATGLLWAPCAGPILGLVLTGAALQGTSGQTVLLLAAYAAGAVTQLAIALLAGGRLFATMKRSLPAGEAIRRGAGVVVLATAAAIAFGLDTGLLARLSYAGTWNLEQALLDGFDDDRSTTAATMVAAAESARNFRKDYPVEGEFPSLDGAVQWLNSPPLSPEQLRGKVVLVDFWTYSCINCIRTIPYINAWAEKYKDQGLVVLGVHAPEFAFEKKIDNVRNAVADFRIGFPVAIDNTFKIWRSFRNSYWPALYFIDAQGRIRHHQFGEGGYDKAEKVIQDLLADAGRQTAENGVVQPDAVGAQAAPDLANIRSSETYIGYERAANFASNEPFAEREPRTYTTGPLHLNDWGLSGDWTVGPERATLNKAGGGVTYRFKARDLHLVLGPGPSGRPVRFQVTVDGKPPGADHGSDTDAEGQGTVERTRLYQLVRQSGAVTERTFEIRFLDPGAEAFVFTFG